MGGTTPAVEQLQEENRLLRLRLAESGGGVMRVVGNNTYAGGTYDIFVRFILNEGTAQQRIFWNPAGDGSEYAQSMSTRYLANWELRIESGSPGAEWLKIGEVVKSGGAPAITDMRPLFFEGTVDSTYESAWSTEGGGVANDRNADRQQYGVKDLQTFTAAMRQCFTDIRGRGTSGSRVRV